MNLAHLLFFCATRQRAAQVPLMCRHVGGITAACGRHAGGGTWAARGRGRRWDGSMVPAERKRSSGPQPIGAKVQTHQPRHMCSHGLSHMSFSFVPCLNCRADFQILLGQMQALGWHKWGRKQKWVGRNRWGSARLGATGTVVLQNSAQFGRISKIERNRNELGPRRSKFGRTGSNSIRIRRCLHFGRVRPNWAELAPVSARFRSDDSAKFGRNQTKCDTIRQHLGRGHGPNSATIRTDLACVQPDLVNFARNWAYFGPARPDSRLKVVARCRNPQLMRVCSRPHLLATEFAQSRRMRAMADFGHSVEALFRGLPIWSEDGQQGAKGALSKSSPAADIRNWKNADRDRAIVGQVLAYFGIHLANFDQHCCQHRPAFGQRLPLLVEL